MIGTSKFPSIQLLVNADTMELAIFEMTYVCVAIVHVKLSLSMFKICLEVTNIFLAILGFELPISISRAIEEHPVVMLPLRS